jgi:glycosyltransferase involved in cell wall biosynthesis
MAEFAGSAAWTAPAGDAAALAAALEDVLAAGQGELERRRADGIERAAAFTWERTASVHLEAYAAASR